MIPQLLGNKEFVFSENYLTCIPTIDPRFEVSVDGSSWSPPSSFSCSTPNSVVCGYPFPFWGAVWWRILTTPVKVTFANTFVVPQGPSPIPFP